MLMQMHQRPRWIQAYMNTLAKVKQTRTRARAHTHTQLDTCMLIPPIVTPSHRFSLLWFLLLFLVYFCCLYACFSGYFFTGWRFFGGPCGLLLFLSSVQALLFSFLLLHLFPCFAPVFSSFFFHHFIPFIYLRCFILILPIFTSSLFLLLFSFFSLLSFALISPSLSWYLYFYVYILPSFISSSFHYRWWWWWLTGAKETEPAGARKRLLKLFQPFHDFFQSNRMTQSSCCFTSWIEEISHWQSKHISYNANK